MGSHDSRSKFVELANKRVNRTLDSFRLIGNLSNKSNYQYSDQDVHKIFAVLQAELTATKAKFLVGKKTPGDSFDLEALTKGRKEA
jgi:hypothetical protein